MKTITLFVESLANIEPGNFGHRVHATDPDKGVDYSRRTHASGFAIPYAVSVNDKIELAENSFGETAYFWGDTMISFHFNETQEVFRSKSAQLSPKQATEIKDWTAHKCVCLAH